MFEKYATFVKVNFFGMVSKCVNNVKRVCKFLSCGRNRWLLKLKVLGLVWCYYFDQSVWLKFKSSWVFPPHYLYRKDILQDGLFKANELTELDCGIP